MRGTKLVRLCMRCSEALAGIFMGCCSTLLKLGRESVFNTTGEGVESIWVLNPFRNLFVVLTPFGLGVTAVILLLICLITKKGYSWFSGYHFTRDPRGFDILPDGTHGTSGFATKKELAEHLELGSAQEVTGMLLGRIKERPDDPEKYSTYVAHCMKPGENNNILCIGAPALISREALSFLSSWAVHSAATSDGGQHPESVIVTDPKGELFEMTAPYFEKNGFYVKAVNFLDMAHSDGWNCLAGLDTNPDLVTTVANTIIQNTSGPKEADDFWSRAELNLLMALIHYVCNKKDDRGNLLPLEQRSLGDVYKILAYKSVNEINRTLAELPPEHPAKGPHGLFLKARENLWGNIIIGLGNRLAVFQNPLVDKITRNHDVDLLLPGQRPCAYFVIISGTGQRLPLSKLSLFLPDLPTAIQLCASPRRAPSGADKLLLGGIPQHRLHGGDLRCFQLYPRLQYVCSGGCTESLSMEREVSGDGVGKSAWFL